MISVDEAIAIIEKHVASFGEEELYVHDALGRILAEQWFADRHMPPFDRVMMDGIAIRYIDFENGLRKFKIEGVAPAGQAQNDLKNEGSCIEVMTGAMKPLNVDTVIRYEDLLIEDGVATIIIDNIRPKQNVHPEGSDLSKGDLLIGKGQKIGAVEIGIAATIGKERVKVKKMPRIMIISTGDELVEINETPLQHQIRKSNVHRLKALLKSWGIDVHTNHLNDEPHEIKKMLDAYLAEYDAILLSGGVSKGKFDFIPDVLSGLGVQKLFHRVKQRPGKPFWFGVKKDCTVFAFPGNPNSSFVCALKYFRHWLDVSLTGFAPKLEYATLSEDVTFKPDLDYFLEVALESVDNGMLMAHPRKGNGSGDLANLAKVDAFIHLSRGLDVFKKGTRFPILRFR